MVIAGSLLGAAEKMLNKGIHPTIIAESFTKASVKAVEFLTEISTPIDLSDRESLLRAASTSLNSKIVSQYSNVLAPIAVNAVTRLVQANSNANKRSSAAASSGASLKSPTSSAPTSPALKPSRPGSSGSTAATPSSAQAAVPESAATTSGKHEPISVDLRDVRIVKKVGGTIDDTELVEGLVLEQNVTVGSGGPTRMEKAKIAVCQFQLSSPKPDMDNQIVVNDYRQMDKILKEERQYLLNMCKKIKKTGCNVLLIQKSILRDAVNELALHFLAKLKILVIKDVERDEIEFVCRTLNAKPIADIEQFTEDKLAYADLVDEVNQAGAKVVKITGIKDMGKTVSVLCTGANGLVLEESERSLHDALCVVRCLVKRR